METKSAAKLSPAMIESLRIGAADTVYGGLCAARTSVVAALQRRGYADRNHRITEAGRAAIAAVPISKFEKLQIVVAWTEEAVEIVRERRTDLGESPEMATVLIAKSVVWLNRGTEKDVVAARNYAKKEGYQVFTFPQSVKDARAAAEKAILAEAAK